MSQSPHSSASHSTKAIWSVLSSRPFVGALLVAGVLSGAAVWRGLVFIERDLAPMIGTNLQKLFNRPVILGPLESFSLTSLKFGPSSVPPHETTLNGRKFLDRDQATADSVMVNFNPLTVLFSQTLNLDIILNHPKASLDQAPDNRWIATRLTPAAEGWLKFKVKTIQAVEGTVQLKPTKAPQRTLQQTNGLATFEQNSQRIKISATTNVDSGGHVALKGQYETPKQSLNLTARAQRLTVPPLLGLLPSVPVAVRSGQFDGVFKLGYQPRQPLRLTSQGTFSNASIGLPTQAIDLKAQQVKTDVVVTVPPNQTPMVQGNAAFSGAQAQVPEALVLANGQRRRQTVRNASGTAVFLGASQKVQLDVKAALAIGGQVKAKGEIQLPLEQAKLLIQAQNVPATLFDRAYRLPIQVQAGRVGGNVTVQLRKNQRPFLQGIATLQNVDAAVTNIPQPFLNTSGYVRLSGLTATLDEVKTRYGSVPVIASGSIDPDRGYNLTAQTEAVEINQALKTLQVKTTPVPIAGRVQVVNLRVLGAIKQPVLTGQVRNVGQLTLDRVPMSSLSASFKVVPSLVTLSDIVANPVGGGAVTGQAVLNLVAKSPGKSTVNAEFQAKGLSGDALARLYQASPTFAVGLVSGTAVVTGPLQAVQTKVAFQAPQGTYPVSGEVLIQQGRILLQNVVAQVKGGLVRASGLINAERVQLTANLSDLALGAVSPQLRGVLSGRVTLTGPRIGFSTQTARAEGIFQFSKGLSLIQDPLTTQVRWDGNQVLVDRASAPNFVAKGSVGVQLQGEGPQVTALNLDITARQYDINRLAVPGLAQNPAHGLADIQGRLSGTLSAPVLTSRLSVNDFKVSQLDFEPQLAGSLDFSAAQGLRLNLDGTRDRIQVALDPAYKPIAIEIRRDQATVIGRRTGPNLFNLAVSDVPLLAVNDYVQQDYGQISGLASGNFTVNLKTYDGSGTFAVTQPSLGRFVGDRLSGQVSYLNGVATLSQGLLVQGENQFQLDATASNLRTNPQVSGRLLIAQAQIEDLIAVGKVFPFPGRTINAVNLGTATNVQAEPISLENIPVWQQLQRLAEIEQFLAQRQAEQKGNGIVPNLEKLTGRIQGEVRFAGSQKAGFNGAFDLQGQDWTLDPYKINQFVAKGTLTPDGISLEPLSLISGDSQAYFSGRIGRDRQGGQLIVNNVPVAPIADLLNLPVDVSGQLNATANLSGTLNNPTIQGTINLDQGILNRAPVQQANGQFSYENARLIFNGLASINSPEPIRVSGNIPYALPFSTVKPTSDTIALTLSVKDQGLTLVNLFTDQVSWIDGKGQLSLEANGTLTKPLLKGSLVVQDATIRTQTLTDPLTQVNGNILFDRDRITVQTLTGRYGQGAVTAQGTVPIFNDALAVSDPLTAVLNDTNLNLKGIYQGEASGNVTVMGSAFRPRLGGVVSLQNGQVLLSRAVNSSGSVQPTAATAQPGGIAPPQFDDLQVQLGKNLRISQPPVLSFLASGNIGLNGSLDAPRPTGLIQFEKGSINLFTTSFQIDPKRENYAQFTPTYGLDPYLKLSLRTTASEVVTGRATTLDEFADVQPGALGSVQSIRIRAHIQGRASQLATRFNDVLDLTSTPSRTQPEILALLSGGVSQAIQSGDAQGAVVNLASSAALNQVQGFLNGFLGSRVNFRLFPLLTPSNSKKSNSAVLQLGAEVGYDITDRLSVSAIQVVTDPTQATQLNASYNLTNKLQFRGSVDLNGGAVGILEYRIRF